LHLCQIAKPEESFRPPLKNETQQIRNFASSSAATPSCAMTKAVQVVIVAFFLAFLRIYPANAQVTNSQGGMPDTAATSNRGASVMPAASQMNGANQVTNTRGDWSERLRDLDLLATGAVIAAVSSTVAIGLGVSLLLCLRRSQADLKALQTDQHDKLVSEMRRFHLSTTAGMEAASEKLLQSIRALHGSLDSALRSLQPAATCIPAAGGGLRDPKPNGGDRAPMDCGLLQEELEFLRWLRESAAANREITTVSGHGGDEGRRFHCIRASRIPLTWVKSDMERAVARLAQLNRYARSVLKLNGSGPCLVKTRQTRLALSDIDSGTPSPWVIEVDVDLLEQVLLETDKLKSAEATQ